MDNNSCGKARMVRLIPALFFSFVLASCSRNGATSEPGDTGAPAPSPAAAAPTQDSEWKAVEQLEAQARAIARIDGCNASSDCASAAVGKKACGSPRDYL